MKTPSFDKYLMPLDSPIAQGTPVTPHVPWEWSIKQKIQAHKIRSSIGQFNNLSGTNNNTNITNGTFTTSVFNTGTINNSVFSGTISQPSVTGGTFLNPTDNTGTYNTSAFNNGTLGTCLGQGGTYNNVTLGTPSVTGGTANFGSYQAGGVAGVTGTAIYVKTIDFVGGTYTVGTVITKNGIITSIN